VLPDVAALNQLLDELVARGLPLISVERDEPDRAAPAASREVDEPDQLT